MAILGYIKKHGILHAIQVFYKYKLNIIPKPLNKLK